MILLRVLLGYVLASAAAFATIMLLSLALSGETLNWPITWREYREMFEGAALGTAFVGAIMFIPSLFFFALAWGLRGPSLLACGLFGAGGGVLSLSLIILVGGDIDGVASAIGVASLLGAAGLVAGLVFWFVAVWPRPPALPAAPGSPKSPS